MFNGAIIFCAWCTFDTAANINRVRRDGFYGVANILRVQTTREDKESGEGSRCSRGRPVTCQASTAAKIRVMCVDKHVTLRKRRGVFGLESLVSAESANDPKFTS